MLTNLPTSSTPESGVHGDRRPLFAGLDLSLTDTGVAIIRADASIHTQRIKSRGARSDALLDRAARFNAHVNAILEAFPEGSCLESITVEGPAFASRSAHAHDMGGFWWAVVLGVLNLGHTVHVAPPANVKQYATGKGNASKDEVLAQVVKRFPSAAVSNNNEADAVVLAAMGARHHGQPIDDMPARHVAALEKVGWAA